VQHEVLGGEVAKVCVAAEDDAPVRRAANPRWQVKALMLMTGYRT
jgi:hypothetical protein